MGEMSATRRRSVAVWTGLLLVGAAALPAGSASAAATLEPRPTPAAAPTDRTMELVSPAEKHGAPIDAVLRIADGEDGGVLFQSPGAFADVQSNLNAAFYRARRGPHGWKTVGMQPRPTGRPTTSFDVPTLEAADGALDSLVVTSNYPFVPGAPDIPPVRPVVTLAKTYRVGPDAAVDWLSSDTPTLFGTIRNTTVSAVSEDTQRLLLFANDRSEPSGRLYVRDGDRTVPVDVDPEGNAFGDGVNPVRNGMSDDGQTVVFAASVGGSPSRELYVRRNALRPDADTVVANRSRRAGDPPGTVSGGFLGISSDGRRVLITSPEPLTDDAPAGEKGLYAYDPVTDDLQYRFPIGGANTLVAADRDLRRLYMMGGPIAQPNNLWVVDDQGSREVVPGANLDPVNASISLDGTRLAFLNDKGLDGGYDGRQMYVYDATDGPDGSLTCVSCRAGESSGGDARFNGNDVGIADQRGSVYTNSFTTDGSFFFMSTGSLVPGAPEGPVSTYEYRDGTVRLLVAGTAAGNARFAGASPGGTDVFLITRQALVPEDTDSPVADLYSYRRGGGFPPEPECTDCEPPAPPDTGGPAAGLAVGSLQDGPLSVGERTPVPTATSKPTIVSRRAKDGTVTLRIRVAEAGTLRVTGSGLQRVSRRVTRAGTYALSVRLTSYGRRALSRKGRLRVRPRVRLEPRTGAASDARTTLTIKRTTRRAA